MREEKNMTTFVSKVNQNTRKGSLLHVFCVLAVLLFIVVYQWQPFSVPWDDLIVNHLTTLAAVMAAVFATRNWLHFHPDEPPKAIWGYFAIGLWCWAGAEEMWALMVLFWGDVPGVSIADFFWSVAYIFFAISMVRQYQVIYSLSRRQRYLWLGGSLLALLAATLIGTKMLYTVDAQSEQTWLETLVMTFYPFGDLAIALAAIWLSKIFGRGLWGRVWWGLLAFVVSDAFYTWLNFTGIYSVSVDEGNLLSLFADTLYLVAYLLLVMACYAQLRLLKDGPPALEPLESLEASPAGA